MVKEGLKETLLIKSAELDGLLRCLPTASLGPDDLAETSVDELQVIVTLLNDIATTLKSTAAQNGVGSRQPRQETRLYPGTFPTWATAEGASTHDAALTAEPGDSKHVSPVRYENGPDDSPFPLHGQVHCPQDLEVAFLDAKANVCEAAADQDASLPSRRRPCKSDLVLTGNTVPNCPDDLEPDVTMVVELEPPVEAGCYGDGLTEKVAARDLPWVNTSASVESQHIANQSRSPPDRWRSPMIGAGFYCFPCDSDSSQHPRENSCDEQLNLYAKYKERPTREEHDRGVRRRQQLDEPPVMCESCGELVPSLLLREHVRLKHAESDRYAPAADASDSGYRKEEEEETEQDKPCDEEADEASSDASAYVCMLCGGRSLVPASFSGDNYEELLEHVRSEHRVSPTSCRRSSLSCPHCSVPQMLNGNLKDDYQRLLHHMSVEHGRELPDYFEYVLCIKCDYQTYSTRLLKMHIKHNHGRASAVKSQSLQKVHDRKASSSKAFGAKTVDKKACRTQATGSSDKKVFCPQPSVKKAFRVRAPQKIVFIKKSCPICSNRVYKLGRHMMQVHGIASCVKRSQSRVVHEQSRRPVLGKNKPAVGKKVRPAIGQKNRPARARSLLAPWRTRLSSDFECLRCGKRFQYEKYLATHVKDLHTKRGGHKCRVCSTKLDTKYDLLIHLLSVHDVNVWHKRVWYCAQCDFHTIDDYSLKRHTLLVHATPDGKRPKPSALKCDVCGELCVTSALLSQHKRRCTVDAAIKMEPHTGSSSHLVAVDEYRLKVLEVRLVRLCLPLKQE